MIENALLEKKKNVRKEEEKKHTPQLTTYLVCYWHSRISAPAFKNALTQSVLISDFPFMYTYTYKYLLLFISHYSYHEYNEQCKYKWYLTFDPCWK